ncbi:hypothetical protein ABIE44_002795 [Marmoricola sp. OAE513]|uniref:hypothetical protein n=1 Tax=Marmoricola sp. OAE513 TaxID=2817894 RepID=UPI001AEABB7B
MSSETPVPQPPSAPQSPDPSTGPSSLALPTPAAVGRALRAPLVGLGITFLVAIVMVVLIAVAAGLDSDGDSGVDSSTIHAIGVLLAMPLQLVAMALFGNLHINDDGGVSGALLAPPLGLTAVFLYVTARVGRTAAPAADEGSRAILAGAVGLLVAVVITPVTWAAAMRDDGTVMHAASVSLFLGAWFLTGAAVYLGSRLGAGVPRPAWIATEYAEAARLWVQQVVLWIAVALPILCVAAILNEGVWLALLAPLWVITLGLDTYAVGHLGGISVFTETAQAWDFDPIWAVLMLVGAVLLTVLGAVAWHQRRDQAPAWLDNPTSWTVLPTIFFGGAVVVLLLPSITLGGGFEGMGASFTVRPSPLTLAVLPVFGFVVEVLSRFVAPGLLASAPALARLRGTPLPAQTVVGTPTAAEGAPAAPRPPLTDAEKAQWKRLAIIGGVVVVLLGAGSATISGINSAKYSAEATAEKYLDALQDGDAEKALGLADVEDGNTDLLTDEIYGAAEKTFTSYEIEDTSDGFGGVTRVEVELRGLEGGKAEVELELRKDGKTGVFFDKWEVTDGGLATRVSFDLPEGADSVAVNGTEVEIGSGEDVYLFPGTYDINPYGDNKWLSTDGAKTVVEAGSYSGYAEIPEATASDAFREEVDRQLSAYLDTCMAATTIDPDGCPNSGYNSDAVNVRWTLTTPPTVDYDSFDGEFPAQLSTDSGQASATFEYDANYGFGPKDMVTETYEDTLYLSVTVEEVDGGLKVTVDE